MSATSSALQMLRRQLVQSQSHSPCRTVVSTGLPSVDALLPHAGLPSGSLIEWISDGPGHRASSIALRCAIGFMQRSGVFAVVDGCGCFNPAAVCNTGIPLSRLLVVRPQGARAGGHCCSVGRGSRDPLLQQRYRTETLWALEQLGRCPGVQVVVAWVDRLSSTAQRRLQLAVETSGATVFLIRPAAALHQTSWADVRFHVQSARATKSVVSVDEAAGDRSRIAVRLIRSKNAVLHNGCAWLECHHETGHVLEVSELARAAGAEETAC
jgi:protein ImuA